MSNHQATGQNQAPQPQQSVEQLPKVIVDIVTLIQEQAEYARKTYGKRYSTNHEAYAVLLEEYDEVIEELNKVSQLLPVMWAKVKADEVQDNVEFTMIMDSFLHNTINCIKELIHVGAVIHKFSTGVVHPPKNKQQEVN